MSNRIEFDKVPWHSQAKGIRQKVILRDSKKFRLVEFSYGFVEEDWCSNGHMGYVLDGSFSIRFDMTTVHYKQGDGIWIEPGEKQKHKVMLKPGQKVKLILIEDHI